MKLLHSSGLTYRKSESVKTDAVAFYFVKIKYSGKESEIYNLAQQTLIEWFMLIAGMVGYTSEAIFRKFVNLFLDSLRELLKNNVNIA